MANLQDNPALAQSIAAARQGLGRSRRVQSLFEYLASSSLEGRSPKESELAIEVFGRQPDFDPAHDAIVRVYVHKLRQRLDDMRADAGVRLTIPRGEYRLALSDEGLAIEPQSEHRRSLALAAAVAAVMVLTAIYSWTARPRNEQAVAAQSELWSKVIGNGRPTIIAIGDYYIFADTNAPGGALRLVREYTVNSAADLARFKSDAPDRAAGYRDLDLHYLPVGSAEALASVSLVLGATGDTQVLPVSQLTASMLRDNNVVYIGYLSGLGVLRDATFAGSRYSVGETWDDIINTRTGERFESGAGLPSRNTAIYADFGYFSTFEGPTGNRFIIIAGTRDSGLSQMSRSAMTSTILDKLAKVGGPRLAAEALFGVKSLEEINVSSRLILASPLDQARIWNQSAGTAKAFPPG